MYACTYTHTDALILGHNTNYQELVSATKWSLHRTLTLLESWLTIYPFLAPRLADATILYSHALIIVSSC